MGRRLLEEAIAHAPAWDQRLGRLIFGHNEPSLRLFERLGFERWGFLPRIARVDGIERDLVMVGRHLPASERRSPRDAAHMRSFLVADDEMNHAGRIGNPKTVEIFAQLFDFIAARERR